MCVHENSFIFVFWAPYLEMPPWSVCTGEAAHPFFMSAASSRVDPPWDRGCPFNLCNNRKPLHTLLKSKPLDTLQLTTENMSPLSHLLSQCTAPDKVLGLSMLMGQRQRDTLGLAPLLLPGFQRSGFALNQQVGKPLSQTTLAYLPRDYGLVISSQLFLIKKQTAPPLCQAFSSSLPKSASLTPVR